MKTKDLADAALFAALTAVLSQVSFSLGPIPFSLGIMGAFLCGMMLKPATAVLAVAVYLLLGAVGLPVFAGFSGGAQVIVGLTGGYLVGYLLIAWVTALACRYAANTRKPEEAKSRRAGIVLAASVLGLFLCYALGTVWFVILSSSTLGYSLSVCVIPFILPDCLKIVFAYFFSQLLKQRLAKADIRL